MYVFFEGKNSLQRWLGTRSFMYTMLNFGFFFLNMMEATRAF